MGNAGQERLHEGSQSTGVPQAEGVLDLRDAVQGAISVGSALVHFMSEVATAKLAEMGGWSV